MGEFDDDFSTDSGSTGGGYKSPKDNNSGNSYGGNKGGYSKGGYQKRDFPPAIMPISVAFYSNKDLPEKAFEKMVVMAKEFNDAGYVIRVPLTWDHCKRFMDSLDGVTIEKFGPWKKDFNEIIPDSYVSDGVKDLVRKVHTNLDSLADSVQNLVCAAPLAVMGKWAANPTQFLILYTPDGVTSGRDTTKETGYASLTIKMANILNVEILNLGDSTFSDRYSAVKSSIISPENYGK